MRRFWRWKGFMILFMITAALALMSFFSCKKSSSSNVSMFEDDRKATVTMKNNTIDSGFYYRDTLKDTTE